MNYPSTESNLKYGISQSNGKICLEMATFTGKQAAGDARQAYSAAREALLDGETIALYSINAMGARFTLETARQIGFADLESLRLN